MSPMEIRAAGQALLHLFGVCFVILPSLSLSLHLWGGGGLYLVAKFTRWKGRKASNKQPHYSLGKHQLFKQTKYLPFAPLAPTHPSLQLLLHLHHGTRLQMDITHTIISRFSGNPTVPLILFLQQTHSFSKPGAMLEACPDAHRLRGAHFTAGFSHCSLCGLVFSGPPLLFGAVRRLITHFLRRA